MATDRTPAGSARITKSKRVEYVVTQADVDALAPLKIDVPWDDQFTSTSYTCAWSFELADPLFASGYYALGFKKQPDKVTVAIGPPDSIAAGDVIIVDAIAIHD
jgi:hypothetical protein